MTNFDSALSSFLMEIDSDYYSEVVVAKSVYWFSGDYTVSVAKGTDCYTVIFKRKEEISDIEKQTIETKFMQYLNDNKAREIIEKETSLIKNILLVKALAHGIDTNDELISKLLNETDV